MESNTLIDTGILAAIRLEMDIGTLIILTKAIRGEGTSYYYVPENVDAIPNKDIVQALRKACRELNINCVKGDIFTTDAIHKETRKLVEALKSRNIIGIDTETTIIFTIRNVPQN